PSNKSHHIQARRVRYANHRTAPIKDQRSFSLASGCFSLASEGDAEGWEALGVCAVACRLMQAAYTSAYVDSRLLEALDAPGWTGAGVLPGETPGVVGRSDRPDMLAASSSQSAVSEYAVAEIMTDTPKTTTHNTRGPRPESTLIIYLPPSWLCPFALSRPHERRSRS